MASNMSRRYSTMELSAPTYQKDMTNDVRLKLAKVRARSRSFCAPSSPPSATPVELKTKKSSQLPRSSVTQLTTSAKAKLRSPQSNGRNITSTTNAPEPNNRRHHTTCGNKQTAAPATVSISTKPTSSQRHLQRTKSTRSTTKKLTDSNSNTINSYYNDDDDTMIKFFESDSDEDDLFLRNTKTKSSAKTTTDHQSTRRQRRTTMPPRLDVSTRRLSTSYPPERSASPVMDKGDNGDDDNADKNLNQSMWSELQELKSRLAKLEVQASPTVTATTTTVTTNDNIKKSSICSPPITRPSSIASVLLSPHSSLVDSACSISNNEMPSHSQKMLQDTVTRLQQHLRQDDHNNNNNTFMNTLADLVAETININQSLAHLQSQQQQQQLGSGHSNNHLTNLQKSSERQINLLTDALQLIDNRRQQQTVMDHPASPPLSQSAMDNRVDIISPKPQKSLRISSQQQRQSTHSRAYTSYYEDTMNILSPNYTDDASSQHSNILTTSFNTKNRQQQHRRSIASVATAPVILPHYNKYLDQEITPTRQYYQQQQQTVSSRPVSGILHHNQPSSSYQQQQQQQERYYSSTVERQPSKPSSQSAFQPMTPRVHRLLSMYEAASKPTTLLMTNATTSPPMSPPSVQQQYHQEQVPYIDYRTRS